MRGGPLVAVLVVALAAAALPAPAQIFLPAPRPAEPEPDLQPEAEPAPDAGPAAGSGDTPVAPRSDDTAAEPAAGESEPGDRADDPGAEAGGAPGEEAHPGFKRAPFRTLGPAEPEIILGVETAPRPGARLRRLDKMTGASETVEIATGSVARFGRLEIAVDACEAPPDGRIEGTRAFVRVWDRKHDADGPAFSGWMFADSPALSALDHPRFDVWVISCTTS